MGLSSDLISQFVKVTKDKSETKKESTVYGTIVEYDGSKYVRLDGSDLLTPISTTTDTIPDERVTVTIKNHTATVTGNLSSPAARTDSVKAIGNQISDFETVIADKVSTTEFDAQIGRIDELQSDNVLIKNTLTAAEASIETLKVDNATINEKLTANDADISNLKVNKLDVTIADAKFATIEQLEVTDANVHNLEVTYGSFADLTTKKLSAIDGSIAKLETDKLDANTAKITYATIDKLNATKADITNLEADVADIDTLIFGTASGDTVLGYGNYDRGAGNTNIYGYDILFGIGNLASPGTYKPYLRRGDSITLTFRGAGYITNSKKDVSFWVPLTAPVLGSPTVTAASGNGFVFRQGDMYTHGSSASTYVTPDKYEVTNYYRSGLYIKAIFSNTTNAINNDSIGIYWHGTITFS